MDRLHELREAVARGEWRTDPDLLNLLFNDYAALIGDPNVDQSALQVVMLLTLENYLSLSFLSLIILDYLSLLLRLS